MRYNYVTYSTWYSTMPVKKSEILNLRIDPRIKDGLREAAEKEHRSVTNMVEVLVLRHCDQVGITIPEQKALFEDEDDGR